MEKSKIETESPYVVHKGYFPVGMVPLFVLVTLLNCSPPFNEPNVDSETGSSFIPGSTDDTSVSTEQETDSQTVPSDSEVDTGQDTSPDWNLVWSDEFDGEGAPDQTKWNYEEGYLRNEEIQYYTANRLENARVENGNLVIEARNDNYQGNPVTSASLQTRNIASWTYGRIEVRAKVPTGRGTWPAIWTLGENINWVGWPACGEIDIMEFVGYDPNTFHFTIHTDAYNHINGLSKGREVEVPNAASDFHVFALEWSDVKMDFFLDGERVFVFLNEYSGVSTWPFDEPQYLKLNLAIGGTWGGQEGVDNGIFPATFLVDYVRIYKK